MSKDMFCDFTSQYSWTHLIDLQTNLQTDNYKDIKFWIGALNNFIVKEVGKVILF